MTTESTEAKKESQSHGASVAVQPIVMREYSQGICEDGAAILCDGQMMTIEEILEDLMRQAQQLHDLKKELRQKNKRIRALTEWIRQAGDNTDTCTKRILGTICRGCRCGKAGT